MFSRFLNANRELTLKITLNQSRFSSTIYDLAVIGSGPGGYVAAIKAAQLGLKTACIEKNASLGGTCLNVGCIPSKALLHSSHHYSLAKSGKLAEFGIMTESTSLNLEKMMKFKENCVKTLTGGISALLKHNKVDHIQGFGKISQIGKISVADNQSVKTIEAKNILIAVGSESTPFPGIDIDEKTIVSSTGALSLSEVPKRMVIIGAGVIGLELVDNFCRIQGSVWNQLGSKVTCLEFLQNIGGGNIDMDISKQLLNHLKKTGMNFLLKHKVLSAQKNGSEIIVSFENMENNQKSDLPCDVLLVCVGRRPATRDIGLESLGIKLDDKCRITVDKNFQTTVPNIFAIGDCIQGPMLAHKAEEEGVACVEGIAGHPVHIHYDSIPNVIYTHPEVAWAGITENDAKKAGLKYKIGKFSLSSNGRSRAVGEIDGFVKVITDSNTDLLLGAHIMAPCAGEIINQVSMSLQYGASAEDIARVCFAHPTVAESLKEACMSASFGKPINGI